MTTDQAPRPKSPSRTPWAALSLLAIICAADADSPSVECSALGVGAPHHALVRGRGVLAVSRGPIFRLSRAIRVFAWLLIGADAVRDGRAPKVAP